MRRILFRRRRLVIWSYPAILYVALLAGVVVGNAASHATQLDAGRALAATLILIPPAIVGARLLYVATHWDSYRHRPARIWNRQEGGLTMYGGLPIIMLLSAALLPALGLGFGEFWDVASLTIITAMVFGKMGCLMNGCCAGRPSRSRIAVSLPNVEGVWKKRIPIQCLEAAWACVVLAGASALLGRLPFHGALFLVVAALFGAGRAALECMRELESEASTIGFGKAASILIVITAVGILVVQWP